MGIRGTTFLTPTEDDSDPKEQFVHEMAGVDGYGRSSYINDVVCRYKDASTAWTSASDGVLEERYYYCQNWRGDVSALVHSARYMGEWVKFSPYGIPSGLPGGDADSNGTNNATDHSQIQSWIDAAEYDVRADIDLDGDLDSLDKSLAQGSPIAWQSLQWQTLSSTEIENRRGWGAAAHSTATIDLRKRTYASTLGRWNQRDRFGYLDGMSLYAFARSQPITSRDPLGLLSDPATFGNDCSGCEATNISGAAHHTIVDEDTGAATTIAIKAKDGYCLGLDIPRLLGGSSLVCFEFACKVRVRATWNNVPPESGVEAWWGPTGDPSPDGYPDGHAHLNPNGAPSGRAVGHYSVPCGEMWSFTITLYQSIWNSLTVRCSGCAH